MSRWRRSREGESNEQVLKRVRFINVAMLESTMFRSTFNIYHKDVLCSPVLRALLPGLLGVWDVRQSSPLLLQVEDKYKLPHHTSRGLRRMQGDNITKAKQQVK